MLIQSPLNRRVKIEDSEFILSVTMSTKLELMKCLSRDGDSSKFDINKAVEILVHGKVVKGWSNVDRQEPNGDIKEFQFSQNSVIELPGDVLVELANEAFSIAYGISEEKEGNSDGSESK